MKRDCSGAVLRFVVSVLALGAAGTFAFAAAASKTYPAKIQATLEMSCAPPCILCHETPEGDYGTATRPFAQAIRTTGGLNCCQPDAIPGALLAMEKGDGCSTPSDFKPGKCDSDADGVPDIDELREGSNPNVAGEATFCTRYGCGARVARGKAHFDWVALLIAGAAGATLIAGSRRSRTRG